MEKIEVGEYVRTDNGEIHKVLDTEKGSIKIKSQYKEWIGLCCIKKHSEQLIDLIEVGDYVNGYYVEDFIEKNKFQNKLIITEAGMIDNNDIKSIVTKEMFSSVEYRVENN